MSETLPAETKQTTLRTEVNLDVNTSHVFVIHGVAAYGDLEGSWVRDAVSSQDRERSAITYQEGSPWANPQSE